VESEFQNASVDVQHALTPQLTAQGVIFGSRFESESDNKTTTIGVGLGADYAFSEQMTGSVFAAYRVSRISPATQDSETVDGLSARASLERKYERGSFQGGVSRELTPSGSGFVITTDVADFRWRHRWRERFTSSFRVELVQTEGLGNSATLEDRTRSVAEVWLTYRLLPEWYLDTVARYVRQDRENGIDADAAAFWVGIRYRGFDRSLGW
ncbi:MAG: hypothetical protein AAF493_29610, partial [Pseudomonadota bacterium]